MTSFIHIFIQMLSVSYFLSKQITGLILTQKFPNLRSKIRFLCASKPPIKVKNEDHWSTVNIGVGGSKAMDSEMSQRIQQAEQWESRQLSDEESLVLNRLLGIEKEIYNLEKGPKTRKDRSDSQQKIRRLTEVSRGPEKSALKGFLELNPFICSGCGTSFQSKTTEAPGFLPKEKASDHHKRAEFIRQQQDALRILDLAGIDANSDAAEEILRDGKVPANVIEGVRNIGKLLANKLNSKSDSMSPIPVDTGDTSVVVKDLASEINDICICQRCYRLQQYGQVDTNLRPGWSDNELLTPERFQELLSNIKDTKSVVTCIVDLFDLKGSILPNLKQIAGGNPIVIAANKIDLLPKDISKSRIINWLYTEIKEVCQLSSPKIVEEEKREEYESKGWISKKSLESEEGILRRSNIHLVSCQSGAGMDELLNSLMTMAQEHGEKVHIMGAANVGKSSFINRMLDDGKSRGPNGGNRNQRRKGESPKVTVSNLPGTTLDFLKIKLPNGITMIDTPGLINKNQLTARLTTAELKKVIPVKPINAVTLRVTEGKCVMIGGLVVVELTEGRPFFMTFFISNEIKLHPTDANKVDEVRQNHIGKLIDPPSDSARMAELGPFSQHKFTVRGDGWKKSSTDIVVSGLGWVTITGVGSCTITVSVPLGIEVDTRPALLPFEASHTTAKFTGSRLMKTSRKIGESKSYGWRA